MPEKQIICAWYSNKMSINRLSAPNSNICLIRLCAWCNFVLLLSGSCQVHLVQNTSSLAHFVFILSVRSQFAKNIHTMTDECKYSVFTKPSYISFKKSCMDKISPDMISLQLFRSNSIQLTVQPIATSTREHPLGLCAGARHTGISWAPCQR